jgi:hypothetical protein
MYPRGRRKVDVNTVTAGGRIGEPHIVCDRLGNALLSVQSRRECAPLPFHRSKFKGKRKHIGVGLALRKRCEGVNNPESGVYASRQRI